MNLLFCQCQCRVLSDVFACETLIFDAPALLSVHSTFHIIQNAAETELRRHFLQFAYFVHYVVENLHGLTLDLKPVMELKTHVAYVKDLEAGRAISYGGTFITKRDSRIATIPVGYADGYCRGLSNTGSVLIHGKRAPICGRVCMDQFMVDVTDIPDVKIGDEVTLIGRDGDEVITMEEVGSLSGRFNYEFVCVLGKRIPRVFYRDGKRIASQEYFDEE